MSSKIKNITKNIADNMKDVFGTSEFIMEEINISTVIRNELFLANKDWIKGYKSFLKEPEEKGGILKMLSDIKSLVVSTSAGNSREQFLSFMKKYRKFLQKGLYIVDKEIDFSNTSNEEFENILKVFPEIIVCLTKEVVEKNNWSEIILNRLREEFKIYIDAMYDESYGKTIKVKRITRIGTINLYSNAQKNYFSLRNYLVMQNALLTNLEILSDENKKDPFIYIGAFTRQEDISNLNKEYMIGLRKNINQKIFNILNLNNNSVFLGFMHLRLIKDNLTFLLDKENIKDNENLFQVFISHLKENNDLNISLVHEISQYMNIDSEDCKWDEVSPYALENILFLLKNTRVYEEQKNLEIEQDVKKNNDTTLYSKLILLSQKAILNKNQDLYTKELEIKIVEFIVKNFKFLNQDQKNKEYLWLLENISDNNFFDIILISLARDNALQNKEDKYNEIEILLSIYLNDVKKYRHRFGIEYVIWLNRFEDVMQDKMIAYKKKQNNLLSLIPTIEIIDDEKSYINKNITNLSEYLNMINSKVDQSKFFVLMEGVNQLLLGTDHLRGLLDSYKICNKSNLEQIDLFQQGRSDNKSDLSKDFTNNMLANELKMILKENLETNYVLNDSFLLKSDIPFKGIKTKNSPIDYENKTVYGEGDTSLKLNHFFYAMTYQYIGKAAFVFEDEFMSFINQQRGQKSFENIASIEILFFMKDWLYRMSREGGLKEKIDEQDKEKEKSLLEEALILEEINAKEKERARKKI